MTIEFVERESDSPYVQSITHGYTVGEGSALRPAECHWHMVFSKVEGRMFTYLVGPWRSSGQIQYGSGAEILWIRFKLGAFMPHLPTTKYLETEILLPESLHKSFCLKGSSWELPDFENADTFINRLIHQEILVFDPVVNSVLDGHSPDISPRTVRHRFLSSTGLSHKHIQQAERARLAVNLLESGTSILDTVFEAGYYDQPHLTRSLKQFIGYTPAQIVEHSKKNCAPY